MGFTQAMPSFMAKFHHGNKKSATKGAKKRSIWTRNNHNGLEYDISRALLIPTYQLVGTMLGDVTEQVMNIPTIFKTNEFAKPAHWKENYTREARLSGEIGPESQSGSAKVDPSVSKPGNASYTPYEWDIETSSITHSVHSQPGFPPPYHPKGLRALPPELRMTIFKKHFAELEMEVRASETPADDLLTAFLRHDELFYGEALEACYTVSTVIARGEWTSPNCQWLESEAKSSELTPDMMVAIRKLRIHHCYTITMLPYYPTISPTDLSMGIYFNCFRNITELALDLKALTSMTAPQGLRLFAVQELYLPDCNVALGHKLARPLIAKFSKLTKLSISLEAGGHRFTGYNWSPSSSILNPRVHENTQANVFEQITLEVITAALGGVKPKLTRVRSCTTRTRWEYQVYESQTGRVGVTWFWEAEKRKTLMWDEGKAMEKHEELGLEVLM